MGYFNQLNLTMASKGATRKQYQDMEKAMVVIARSSRTKTTQDVARYTIILMNQECGREEAIYKMKTFIRG